MLFVEGGGDHNDALKTECRKGFRIFLEKTGFAGRMPKIIACGGRQNAYDQFSIAVSKAAQGDVTLLLVDSEAPVSSAPEAARPWEHVRNRQGDGWLKPKGATHDALHFMVECMENWFLADKEAVESFFAQGFRQSAIPANPQVEKISKPDVLDGLINATRDTKKGTYGKGAHSFKILARIDPAKVRQVAPYAERLLSHLDNVL
ncbi:MAG: DUF4276 family protein [Deltaproteobacteria bacterium]|nr:DUF4276 family protein [Deltaproteobacteria bacterium]